MCDWTILKSVLDQDGEMESDIVIYRGYSWAETGNCSLCLVFWEHCSFNKQWKLLDVIRLPYKGLICICSLGTGRDWKHPRWQTNKEWNLGLCAARSELPWLWAESLLEEAVEFGMEENVRIQRMTRSISKRKKGEPMQGGSCLSITLHVPEHIYMNICMYVCTYKGKSMDYSILRCSLK